MNIQKITIIINLLHILGYIRGLEKIWLMGDDFAAHTLQEYLRNKKKQDGNPSTYIYNQYEVREFMTKSNSSNSRNILSRIRNCVATALNEHATLPRLIVFILDDDIINSIPEDRNSNLDIHYERILCGLFNMISKVIDIYKEMLPNKAKRENVPHLLWIAPPTHKYFSESNNERRSRFTTALGVAVSLQRNMSMLRLVKFWDHDDANLFLKEQYRYTSQGLTCYWQSVDASVKFWNIALAKKFAIKSTPSKGDNKNSKEKQHNKDDALNNLEPRSRGDERRSNHSKQQFHKSSGNPYYGRRYYDNYKWQSPFYKQRRRRLMTPP